MKDHVFFPFQNLQVKMFKSFFFFFSYVWVKMVKRKYPISAQALLTISLVILRSCVTCPFQDGLWENNITANTLVGFRSLVEEESTYWALVNSLNLQNELMNVHQSDISKLTYNS